LSWGPAASALDLPLHAMDVKPRPCANPACAGKSFGSNAAAWWGFQYKDLITDPKPREVCTIYEIDTSGQRNRAQAVYNFRWTAAKQIRSASSTKPSIIRPCLSTIQLSRRTTTS
jgi:hypothetical protein